MIVRHLQYNLSGSWKEGERIRNLEKETTTVFVENLPEYVGSARLS